MAAAPYPFPPIDASLSIQGFTSDRSARESGRLARSIKVAQEVVTRGTEPRPDTDFQSGNIFIIP